MKELSLNILDIAQNSVKAGAKDIDIRLTETADTLTIEITDDGCGMDAEAVRGVIDRSSLQGRRETSAWEFPLLKLAAEQTGRGDRDILRQREGRPAAARDKGNGKFQ